jgi:hypothetical protein
VETLLSTDWQETTNQALDPAEPLRTGAGAGRSAHLRTGPADGDPMGIAPAAAIFLEGATRLLQGPLQSIALELARRSAWIALLLLLWFAHLAFDATSHRTDRLRLAESLVLVWVLIRLRSLLVRDERLARVIAIFAWIIAALNIAGLITPVIVSLRMKVAVPTNYIIRVY